LVNNVYTDDGKLGLPGNDDYGTMSSWLIWGLIGFYPMAGSEQFIVGSPSFENITINRHAAHGLSDITVVAYNNSLKDNVYIKKSIVNGALREEPFIYWKDLNLKDGKPVLIEFWMTDNVNEATSFNTS
jgi:putative alpha-1,2-mannosidase